MPDNWYGRTILDLNVRQKYHVSILAVKRDNVLEPLPKTNHIFREGESMLILGANKDINKFLQI